MLKTHLFQQAAVRDLAWVINSPPIIQGTINHTSWTNSAYWQQQYQEVENFLFRLDANPTELNNVLEAQKDKRLGHRFETLCSFFFKLSRRYKILAKNLQIQDEGQTIGEFDFIIRDTLLNKTQHWEIACKFYLGIGDTCHLSNWYGPMLRDRLDIKLEKMQTKQSQLSNHSCAAQHLNSLGIQIDERICLMKGRLFHSILNKQRSTPSLISGNHQSGWWARLKDFKSKLPYNNMRWVILDKKRWFSPQLLSATTNTYPTAELLDLFLADANPKPMCIAGFSQEHNTTKEKTRGFLVNNKWGQTLNSQY